MRFSIGGVIVLLIGCWAQFGRAAEEQRLMLNIIEAAALLPDRNLEALPVLTLGALPADRELVSMGPNAGRQTDFYRHYAHIPRKRIEQLAAGGVALEPPLTGSPVLVLLASPRLSSGFDWFPAALARSGHELTLTIDSFSDDGPRARNAITRNMQLLSLGMLEAGDYKLHVEVRDLFQQPRTDRLYELRAMREAVLNFTVADARALRPGREPVAPLVEKSFSEIDSPHGNEQPRWQQPRHVARDVKREQRPVEVLPQLRAGTFEIAPWLSAAPAGPSPLPVMLPAVAKSPVYALVVGPTLNSGEWMTLREVVWNDKSVVLRVELWRDTGDRRKNIIHQPVALVPLATPGGWDKSTWKSIAAEYQVRVEWTCLTAPGPGGAYVPAPAKDVDDLTRNTRPIVLKIAAE